MTRARKQKEKLGYAIGKSSFGKTLVATCELGIVAIMTGKDANKLLQELRDAFPKTDIRKNEWDAENALTKTIAFLKKPGAKLDVPVYLKGTPFQKRVWQAVQEIPPGKTATYTDIARKIGKPRAMRAVGNACSSSHLFMAVPCHRVLRSDHSVPRGDHLGMTRRQALIDRETKK